MILPQLNTLRCPSEFNGTGRILWIIFLYLKFPPARNASQREAGGEEILNEQSATPKKESLLSPDLRDRLLKVMKNNPPGTKKSHKETTLLTMLNR
jgi:hypothetical protein